MYKYVQTRISRFIIAGICLMFACVFAIRISNGTTGGASTNPQFSLSQTNSVKLQDAGWYLDNNRPVDTYLNSKSSATNISRTGRFIHNTKVDADSKIYNKKSEKVNPKLYRLVWTEAYAKRYTSKPFTQNFKRSIRTYNHLESKQ